MKSKAMKKRNPISSQWNTIKRIHKTLNETNVFRLVKCGKKYNLVYRNRFTVLYKFTKDILWVFYDKESNDAFAVNYRSEKLKEDIEKVLHVTHRRPVYLIYDEVKKMYLKSYNISSDGVETYYVANGESPEVYVTDLKEKAESIIGKIGVNNPNLKVITLQ